MGDITFHDLIESFRWIVLNNDILKISSKAYQNHAFSRSKTDLHKCIFNSFIIHNHFSFLLNQNFYEFFKNDLKFWSFMTNLQYRNFYQTAFHYNFETTTKSFYSELFLLTHQQYQKTHNFWIFLSQVFTFS